MLKLDVGMEGYASREPDQLSFQSDLLHEGTKVL
jgi:hypothetical protein